MAYPFLGEGRMSAPTVSSQALGALQKAIARILEILEVEIQAVQEEFELVSPATVRVEPDAARGISYVGKYSPQEIRSILAVVARELGNQVDRLSMGSLAPYSTTDQARQASTLRAQVQQLVDVIRNQDALPIGSGHQADVQAYLDMHLASAAALLQSAEKGVVEAEAGSVPVLEPSERGPSTTTLVIGIGAVAGIGVLLWLFA